jgi:hypothetical protein
VTGASTGAARRALALACAAVTALPGVAGAGSRGAPSVAQPKPGAPPRAPVAQHTVVLAPLSTLGSESTAAPVRRLAADLEAALGQQPGVKVIGSAAALDAIKQAKKPMLRSCDGDTGCLAELGKLVGADWVVAGEVGGLGDVQVVYLELIDVGSAREVRNTTLQGGADDPEGGPRGAAVRLIAPERFVGRVDVKVDVAGAAIYVDGKRLARSPSPPLELPVGTHALRVTHPEFRDFVRFVDVPFDRSAAVTVELQQYPVLERDLKSQGGDGGTEPAGPAEATGPTPWYRRWWALAGFGAVLVTGAAITAGVIADGTDAERTRPVHPPE